MMKTALTLLTLPMALSFFAGFFEWSMDDGVYIFIGITMIAALIWAWIIELNKK